MLQLLRVLNFAMGALDFVLALACLQPGAGLRPFIPAPCNTLMFVGTEDVPKMYMYAWFTAMLGIVRVHAALWPHDKSGYRTMCWSHIFELSFWTAMVLHKFVDLKTGTPFVLLSAGLVVLCVVCYGSAIGKNSKKGAASKKGK